MKIALLLIMLVSNISLANFAKVLVLKGKASKLLPGRMKAVPIKKGEMLPELTSILTYDKSFIRVQFPDKSVVNLGAASKMVVAQKKNKDGTVINFLKGVMRSTVDKEKKDGTNKMLIKTRTAVMGIRGTKFITSYNPVNKNTALITVEGEVAIAKIDAKTAKDKVTSSMPDEKLLEKKLAMKKDVIEVKPGEFSGTTEETTEAIKSVKIAPKQFEALAKSVDSEAKTEDVYKESKEIDTAENDLKSGGLVDLSTGFYVPPKEDAKFDTSKGVFVATNEIGKVDQNGNYAAPEGTKLDAMKGFISKDQNNKVAINDLNDGLKKKYKKVKIFNKEKKDDGPSWISKWLPENHLVKFYTSYQQERSDLHASYVETVPGSVNDKRNAKLSSNNGSRSGISWIQQWNKYLSTSLNLGFFSYEMHLNQNTDGFQSYDRNVSEKTFQVGIHYNINSRMQLSAFLGDVENYEVNHCRGCGAYIPGPNVNADIYNLYEESIDTIQFQWKHFVFDIKDWAFGYTLSYAELNSKDDNHGDFNYKKRTVNDRYAFSINVSKALNKYFTIAPFFTYQVENIRYENNYNDGALIFWSSLRQHRKVHMLGTELIWDF